MVNVERNVLTCDNIIEFIADRIDSEFDIENVEISNDFPFRFIVKGEQWKEAAKGGFIDYRAANILVSLQRDFFELYNGATGNSLSFKNNYGNIKDVVVRVKIEEGSLGVETCKESVKALFSKLGSWQLTGLVGFGMLLAFGYFTIDSYNKRIAEQTKILNKPNESAAYEQIAKDAIQLAGKSQETIRTIVSYMKPSDVVFQSNVRDEPIGKDDLQRLLIDEQYAYVEETLRVDDRFKVVVFNIKTNSVQIQKGKFKYFATTKLMSEEDKRVLFNTARDASIQERIPEYDLQTSVIVKDGDVSEVYIVAIGTPRVGAISVLDVSGKIKKNVVSSQQLMLPLIISDKP